MFLCVVGCTPATPQVRKYIQKIAKPGIPLTQLCETLEDSVRNLIEARGLDAGGWVGDGEGALFVWVEGVVGCNPDSGGGLWAEHMLHRDWVRHADRRQPGVAPTACVSAC